MLAVATGSAPPTINHEDARPRLRPRLRPERGARRCPICDVARLELVRLRRPQRVDRRPPRSRSRAGDDLPCSESMRMARTSVVVRGDAYRPAMRLVDVGGRLVELHIRRSKRVHGHRIVVRHGLPPELVVRPRAIESEIDEAIAMHLRVARAPAREARPSRARARPSDADRGAGPPRGTRPHRADRAVRGGRARRRLQPDHAARPAQPMGIVLGKGALSFNWRLVLAPHDVLDYVVVHEVCHLAEHNHGAGVLEARRAAAARLSGVEGLARRARLGAPRLPAAARAPLRA